MPKNNSCDNIRHHIVRMSDPHSSAWHKSLIAISVFPWKPFRQMSRQRSNNDSFLLENTAASMIMRVCQGRVLSITAPLTVQHIVIVIVRVRVCCRVLALLFSFVVFLFFRQMYICHNIIIHLCLLMAKSMFPADFANKLWTWTWQCWFVLMYLQLKSTNWTFQTTLISSLTQFLSNCITCCAYNQLRCECFAFRHDTLELTLNDKMTKRDLEQ